MEILKVEDLTYRYPQIDKPAIENLSFSIFEGEFLAVCGATGSGKSTLLKCLKKELRESMTGTFGGKVIPLREDMIIGYVGQNPSEQIVTDKVWHELSFGMENLSIPQNEMSLKIAELSAYFGIEGWFEKDTCHLSGGQKQILNLASVMAMDPDVLILDEPTSFLDPVSADAFLSAVLRLHRDLSVTVIIAEHRLEEIIPVCDRLMILKDGRIDALSSPLEAIISIGEEDELYPALPAAYRLFGKYGPLSGKSGDPPLLIRDARKILGSIPDKEMPEKRPGSRLDQKAENSEEEELSSKSSALEFSHVYFRYRKDLPDVLSDLDLTVREGEITCILGGNAAGKTTAALMAAGLIKPYSGYVKIFGKKIKDYRNQSLYIQCLTMLPQDVEDLFLYDSVREELENSEYDPATNPVSIPEKLYDRHPYDLSGGERQLLALAKVLSTKPKLLILDEPTKGLDAGIKKNLASILFKIKKQGITCLIVTHDAEFAAECADTCVLCFRGRIVSSGAPEDFFKNNRFYTTAACRIGRGILEGYPTVEAMKKALAQFTDKSF